MLHGFNEVSFIGLEATKTDGEAEPYIKLIDWIVPGPNWSISVLSTGLAVARAYSVLCTNQERFSGPTVLWRSSKLLAVLTFSLLCFPLSSCCAFSRCYVPNTPWANELQMIVVVYWDVASRPFRDLCSSLVLPRVIDCLYGACCSACHKIPFSVLTNWRLSPMLSAQCSNKLSGTTSRVICRFLWYLTTFICLLTMI